jgi:hypothetical protein
MGQPMRPWVRTTLSSLLLPASAGSVYAGAQHAPVLLSVVLYLAGAALVLILLGLCVALLVSVFPQLRQRLLRVINSDIPPRRRTKGTALTSQRQASHSP